jgi:hypothetical protein
MGQQNTKSLYRSIIGTRLDAFRFLLQGRIPNADFTTKTQRTRSQNKILSPFCLSVLCVSVVIFSSVLVVVQRLRRVQLVPRLYMRIG